MADTSVKFFHSGMPNAPQISSAAGSLISVLDACLVTGFGLKTVDSLVVSGGVATATISSGHSAIVDSVALVAGAALGALNGEKKVRSITGSTVVFDAPGVPDGPASGSITLLLAPAGWAKPFSGTNLAAYRSAAPTSTGMYLRVDDTDGTAPSSARVVGYESMSGVDTGSAAFPTAVQLAGGFYWPRADTASGTRQWVLVADARLFYIWIAPTTNAAYAAYGLLYGFGDFVSRLPGDAYGCILSGGLVANEAAPHNNGQTSFGFGETAAPTVSITGKVIARGSSLLGGAVRGQLTAHFRTSGTMSGAGNNATLAYPNPADNGLILYRPEVVDAGSALRGDAPGLYHCPQGIGGAFSTLGTLSGVSGLAGRNLVALHTTDQNTTYVGYSFLDVTGPWR